MDTRPGVRPDPRGTGMWQVRFRVNGKQYTKVTQTGKEANRRMDAIEERKSLVKSRKITIPEGVDVGEWFFTDGRAGFPVEQAPEENAGDIATLIADYLDSRRLDVAAGQLSNSSYASDKYRLAAFQEHCEKTRATDLAAAVGSSNLDAYRKNVLGRLAKRKIGAVSVKHALRTVKALLLWAYDKEKLDTLPRVLKKYAEIALPAPTPEFFTAEEIKRLYDAATDPMRLYILLGLNAGYTQADIATLEHAHIDWTRGMIVRARNKTGQPQEHKLWPRTIELLKDQASNPKASSLVLLAEGERPLLRVAIKEDGTPSKTDSIGQGFRALKKNLNRARKEDEPEIKLPFKCFRKTGANQLAKRYQDNPLLVDLYLAHAPGGMRKHYACQHYDELHKATDWLATVYALNMGQSSSSGGNP